jgi:hypothetical protein
MNRMRKCNDEFYQLAKAQALIKKLKEQMSVYILMSFDFPFVRLFGVR